MRDRDVDMAELQVRKDALVALFSARSGRWQALQAASLGGLVLGLVAVLGGQMGLPPFGILGAVLTPATLLFGQRLQRNEGAFQENMNQVTAEMRRCKASSAGGNHRMSVRTSEEFWEDFERFRYVGAFPWERFFMNRSRRRRGLAPLRLRDIERELDRPRART